MINITIRGQINSANYSYCPETENKDWQNCIPQDPRIDFQYLDCGKWYAIWRNEYGFYYAYCKRLPTRAATDTALIVALCDRIVKEGNQFSIDLEAILDYCIAANSASDIDNCRMQRAISCLDGHLSPHKIDFAPCIGNRDGYRFYRNEEELSLILQNPLQKTYSEINRLFIIDGTENPNPRNSLVEITVPVRKSYFIVGANGTTASKSFVYEEESFDITYHKEGYKDIKKTVVHIEESSSLYIIEGNEIRLKSADNTIELEFKKSYSFSAIDCETRAVIPSFWLTFKGTNQKYHSPNGERINFYLKDGIYEMEFGAPGYKNEEIRFDTNNSNKFSQIPLASKEWLSDEITIFVPVDNKYKPSVATITSKQNTSIADYVGKNISKDNKKFYVSTSPRKNISILKLMLVLCLFFVVGILIGHYVWQPTQSKEPSGVSSVEENKGKEVNTRGASITKEDSHDNLVDSDLEYLNANTIWNLRDLRSEEMRSFLKDELLDNKKEVGQHKEIINSCWDKLYTLIKRKPELFKKYKDRFSGDDYFNVERAVIELEDENNNTNVSLPGSQKQIKKSGSKKVAGGGIAEY